MPREVSYVTKVQEISRVLLAGQLDNRLIDPTDRDAGYGWFVGDDNLETWLDKFCDKAVMVEIKTYTRDESHLLPDSEKPMGE